MKPFPFTKFIPVFFTISGLVIGVGILSMVLWGFRPAIDFLGGSLVQVQIIPKDQQSVSEQSIREALQKTNMEAHTIQSAGEKSWIIRTKLQGEDTGKKIQESLAAAFDRVDLSRFESVGPTLGRELLVKTLIGVLVASGSIMLYLAWRFRGGQYGICAILAMIHDLLVVLGVFSLLGHFGGVEVDTLFVTAVLTVLSFSVHDTIVVFDRIRENLRRFPQESFDNVVNRSTGETMGRSIKNSLAIIFVLFAMTVFGGTTIRYFSLALLVGTITGTYSSPFVAVPLLVVWDRVRRKKRK